MPSWFVTSTGTDIGKTLVTAALVQQLRAAGRPVEALKPVLSGYTREGLAESDAGVLLRALGQRLDDASVAAITPWRFEAPLSPDMAAAREDRSIDFDALLRFCREPAPAPDTVRLIEGVGGVAVPIDEKHTVLDWMAALAAPVVLVAGSYLGTISHTLTALEALRQRDIPLASVVLSESLESPVPLEETAEAIRRHGAAPRICLLPRLPAAPAPWTLAPELIPALGER